MKKVKGQIKTYDEWIEPYLVSNTLELLDAEIPKLKNKIEWIPNAVVLGYWMEKLDESKVIETANQAGIEKIYKCYINDKCDLDAYLMPPIDEMN